MSAGPGPLIHLTEVDSTQSFLERHPELGFCAVYADTQTLGRGRGENRWESLSGSGLWLSAAIPPQKVPPGLILQRAMLAVIEVLEAECLGLEGRLGLKWPNDLVGDLDGRLVKLGGIIGATKTDRVILGLGLNLTQAPSLPDRAFPAACLSDLTENAARLDRMTLAREFQEAWQDLSILRTSPFLWPEAGDLIQWEKGRGRCLGWSDDGRLSVECEDGVQALSVGDVRGLQGFG